MSGCRPQATVISDAGRTRDLNEFAILRQSNAASSLWSPNISHDINVLMSGKKQGFVKRATDERA